jgi:2-polyprenyl-6-hydroxyphenyl methylase/3-demethylubiquinone-9 3-methyltransferase
MQFSFGKNWQSYTHNVLSQEKIAQARDAFRSLLGDIDMTGRSFLDIGFGQGLGLLLADEMGAEVLGIDNDADNLKAIQETCAVFGMTQMPQTHIGSILDRDFLHQFSGKAGFDVVHAWGVLHHTGNMPQAICNAAELVKEGGAFICAIYNQHWSSPVWKAIKRIYLRSPQMLQRVLIGLFYPIIYFAKWATTGEHPAKMDRGMDFYHNLVDWVGGYPYEYAEPEDIVRRVCRLGFECIRFRPARVPTGCNEFIFRKLRSRHGPEPGLRS